MICCACEVAHMSLEYGLVSTTLSESTAIFCRGAPAAEAELSTVASAVREAAAARKDSDIAAGEGCARSSCSALRGGGDGADERATAISCAESRLPRSVLRTRILMYYCKVGPSTSDPSRPIRQESGRARHDGQAIHSRESAHLHAAGHAGQRPVCPQRSLLGGELRWLRDANT